MIRALFTYVPILVATLAALFRTRREQVVVELALRQRSPIVAFFGSTDPLQYGPRGSEDVVFYKDLHCSPCLTNYNLKVSYCADPVCIRTIRVDEVLETIERRFFSKQHHAEA